MNTVKKVMNVDDDPMVRDLVKSICEAAGFEVLSASNGEEAFQVLDAEDRPLDLECIILDVEMPGMSGLDVLTRLKLHSDTQNIPVIMLTCQAAPEDFMQGYNSGASYYITKPFTREQLLYGIDFVTKVE